MKHNELILKIVRSDPDEDWKRIEDSEESIFVYLEDVNLRMESKHGEEDEHVDDFREPWANKFPDSRARSYYVNVYYGATLIERVILVTVDGGRARLPLPRIGSLSVPELNLAVARVFDVPGTLTDYMNRAGLVAE